MNDLCKNCKWRCELYWYGTRKKAAGFLCLQQDAGKPELPIKENECYYFEKRGEK